MFKRKRNAFTLIELIAVLVIMAIIALIVTPLVMSIIRKARISADKRSIDAYGRSIELAIAGYLLDTGSFPTSIEQLTIEYSGDEVVCSTTNLNSDSSIYLAGCTVGGRSVDGYSYGKGGTTPEPVTPSYTAYQVGDHVSYNNVTYYVIEDSDTTNDTVNLLKENPLTKTEMDNLNLTNITISEENGYGKVKYGESIDYSTSTVKQVVDAWKNTAVKPGDNATSRLINSTDLVQYLAYENGDGYRPSETTPTWVYNDNYRYWTMDGISFEPFVYLILNNGYLDFYPVSTMNYMVRPVLELSKSADITMAG